MLEKIAKASEEVRILTVYVGYGEVAVLSLDPKLRQEIYTTSNLVTLDVESRLQPDS